MTEIEIAENLENILKKDENGKPIINLTPIKKTTINPKTQEEYDELMRVYELGNWIWNNRSLATKLGCWKKYKEETCIGAGIDYSTKNKKIFGFCDKDFYLMVNWNIISTEEFYNMQKITPEMIKEINIYFEVRK